MVKEIYIAGEWRLGRGHVIQSLFPADQSVNAEISTASLKILKKRLLKLIRHGAHLNGATVCHMNVPNFI
jgi:hypothetical protein